MKMRTEKQIYDTILNFAKADDRIRVVTLKVQEQILILYQMIFKIMILLFCHRHAEFINSDEWLNVLERDLLCKNRGYGIVSKRRKRVFISYVILGRS